MTESTTQLHRHTHPGLGRRLIAITYDSLLLAACCMASVGIAVMIKVMIVGSASVKASGQPALDDPLLVQAIVIGTIFAFYAGFWRIKGQTLGMQAWRFKLQSESGGIVSIKQCLLRFIVACLSFLCFGLGFLWILISPDKKSWHDMASGTVLVMLPKAAKK